MLKRVLSEPERSKDIRPELIMEVCEDLEQVMKRKCALLLS